MVHKKSLQSPNKSMPTCQASAQLASWTDADVNILLDLAITHKASAGEGMNFKAPFWNAVSDTLPNPSKGGPKTSKVRKIFEVVDCVKNTSRFAYSCELGANIGLENEAIWNEFVKGKGLNRFSALSLSGTSLTDSMGLSSLSDTGSHGESTNTVEGSSAHGTSTLCVPADIEMSGPSISSMVKSTNTQVQMHFPPTPVPPYTASFTQSPSIVPTPIQATSDWHLDQSSLGS
ncbi:hypothetical protein EDD17DRAFT_1763187 [Pisolithus thermaeus]|nr:hypothetical protein EDD17DRAFT_1763187 [Pisolithus thermaeus]